MKKDFKNKVYLSLPLDSLQSSAALQCDIFIYLPLNNKRPSPSMPELKAGEYLLILKAERIIHSAAASSFGFTITPNPNFNFAIVRDGQNHAAWKKDSREARFILELFAIEPEDTVSKNEKFGPHSNEKTSEERTLADLPASDLGVIA